MQTLTVSSWPLSGLLALSLPLFFLGTWLLRNHARKNAPNGSAMQFATMRDAATLNAAAIFQYTRQAATTISASQAIKFAIVFMLGGVIGFLYRDHLLSVNINSYTDVEITENAERAQGWYKLQLRKTHKEFPMRFCPGTAEFPLGTVFDEVRYEDRGWCLSLAGKKLGFVINMEETRNGQRTARAR